MATTRLQWVKFYEALDQGCTIARASKIAKISEVTAYRRLKKDRENGTTGPPPKPVRVTTTLKSLESRSDSAASDAMKYRMIRRAQEQSGVKSYDALCDEAKRALEDFDYFRLRYFGHVPTPWQRLAAEEIIKLLASKEKEYVVINQPPGAGKTTMLHDIICWLICRDRSVRLLLGSATMQQAEKSLNRVRRSLERTVPMKATDDEIQRGLAVDAVATLPGDFGRFKPLDREVWTRQAFVVAQPEGEGATSEKEATLQAYGMDANYLGDRVDGCFWDDLVDPKTTRSVELREQLEERWSDVAESRLEPGGLMVLMGQRLAGDDLYRHCLDMLQPFDLEDEDAMDEMTEEEINELRRDKKYRHIVFKAHYEDKCFEGSHKLSAPPYPEGCLLDPRRISYREIKALMANRSQRFQVVYQQEDVSPDEVFVPNDWIYGYGGHPGCIDKDRNSWEIPSGLVASECMMVATADPSPTNYWAIECWLYAPKYNQRFLIDLHRAKMEAPDFLDFNINEQRFTGIMEEWQHASELIGFPIQFWVVERNAAQRFLLQYDLVKKWIASRGVQVVPHDTTGRSKADEELGVTSIREHYKFGRVRLPGRGEGKTHAMKLIDEVTKYGMARTDDCVMAHWFLEWNLPKLSRPKAILTRAQRPTWASSVARNATSLVGVR